MKNNIFVLIVDDEVEVREMLERMVPAVLFRLGVESFVCDTAFDGENALELINQAWFAPDISFNKKGGIFILITDTTMPLMNGPELASQVIDRRLPVKIVAMSGMNAYDWQGQYEGVKFFLEKPFRMEELQKILQTILKEGRDGKI